MIQKNKIIVKHLSHGTIAAVIGFSAMLATFIYAVKQEPMEKHWQKSPISISLDTLILVLGMSIMTALIINSYQDDSKFASHTAREFLKQTMKEHPELKDFQSVLNNPKAMKSIATMISNNLRESEQKRVLSVAQELLKITQKPEITKSEKIAATKQAHEKIIKIIKEHAATQPDFITEVYAAMAYADMTYVVPSQQKSR